VLESDKPAASARITIRRAVPEEAGPIAQVLYRAFVEYESLYTPQGFAATVLDRQKVLVRMQEGPVWIALREANLLGTVAAVHQAESVWIRGMAVVPQARRLQVGAMLLDEAERFAAAQHAMRIVLSTTPFLGAAIGFYQRSGFERVKGGAHDLFGTPLFTMEKYLHG
jgi:GNAT superfamily N-acetyltransferase